MRVEELSKLSVSQLKEQADIHFIAAETPIDADRDYELVCAQLYLTEIKNRYDERIAKRDFRLEIAVIVLIALELVAAVYEVIETRANASQASQQIAVLEKLNKSASDTAAALSALRIAQESALATQQHTLDNIITMNTALQDAMGLNYAVALEVSFNEGNSHMEYANKGKTNLYLWGSKFDKDPASLSNEGRLITPQGMIYADMTSFRKQAETTIAKDGITHQFPVELHLKSANQKSYVQKCYMLVHWDGDSLKIGMQTISVTAQHF